MPSVQIEHVRFHLSALGYKNCMACNIWTASESGRFCRCCGSCMGSKVKVSRTTKKEHLHLTRKGIDPEFFIHLTKAEKDDLVQYL